MQKNGVRKKNLSYIEEGMTERESRVLGVRRGAAHAECVLHEIQRLVRFRIIVRFRSHIVHIKDLHVGILIGRRAYLSDPPLTVIVSVHDFEDTDGGAG